MIRDDLAELILNATKKAQKKKSLPRTEIPEVLIERPRREEHGDYACSLPLKMIADVNRQLKAEDKPTLTPIQVGKSIVHRMEEVPYVGQVEVAPPGFINVTLSEAWLTRQVDAILAAGDDEESLSIMKLTGVTAGSPVT